MFLSFIIWFLLLLAIDFAIEFIIGSCTSNPNFILDNISLIVFTIGFVYLESYFKVSLGILYDNIIQK